MVSGVMADLHLNTILEVCLLFWIGYSAANRHSASREKAVINPPSKCDVDDPLKIACGESGISAEECEAINCCFEGEQCYYGNAVTVQCTSNGQFLVVVVRGATNPPLNLATVALLEDDEDVCRPVDAKDMYTVFHFPVNKCGTTLTEEDGFLVYENQMTSSYMVAIGDHGSVTRDSHYELKFQCRYSETIVEALVLEVNPAAPPQSLVAPGPLRVELVLANGDCSSNDCEADEFAFTSFYTKDDYPVNKVLQEPVYVEVRVLDRTDPNLVLQLGNCWATSTSDPLSLPQWDLLVNGCPFDETKYHDEAEYQTQVLPVSASAGLDFPTHHKRFVIRMFTFVDEETLLPLEEQVFIHCSTAVCYRTTSETCEQSCKRKRRDISERKVSQGDIVSSEMVILHVPGSQRR